MYHSYYLFTLVISILLTISSIYYYYYLTINLIIVLLLLSSYYYPLYIYSYMLLSLSRRYLLSFLVYPITSSIVLLTLSLPLTL
jgi:hypothetical protein